MAGTYGIPSSAGVPSGVISPFNGPESDVPDGWTLCDGKDGSPDLRDRFVVGAEGSYGKGDKGGKESVTLDESQIPEHNHGIKANDNTNSDNPSLTSTYGTSRTNYTETAGGGGSHENRPPFYALAYIMRL